MKESNLIIKDMPDPIDKNILAQLEKIDTSTIGHLDESVCLKTSFKQNRRNIRAAGTAVTLKIINNDSAVLHYLLDQIRENDFLIIDIDGDYKKACWGYIMHSIATFKKISGIIINGPITDISQLNGFGVPIWFKNVTPIVSSVQGKYGYINEEIFIDTKKITPGQIVLADDNGACILDLNLAKDLITKAVNSQINELKILQNTTIYNGGLALASGAKNKIEETLKAGLK